MEPKQDRLDRFFRLFQSFQCQRIPSHLFIRACESRPTWSSTGEIIERLPLEAGVPEWLVELYNDSKSLFHDTELGNHNGYVESTMDNGVIYLQVTDEGHVNLEVAQSPSVIDERVSAQERIAIILQAFPSNNAEILGEEIIDRLMDVVNISILPLLSSLTESDIEGWLLPKNLEKRESYLVSLLEFLYQVIDVLGIENPLIPLPLLRQISNVISNDTITNFSVAWKGISQILDAYSGDNALQSSFLSPKTSTDQRSNAMVGHILSMLLSNKALLAEPKAPAQMVAKALSDWRPLSLSSPSTMEYLAATSFCSQSQIDTIGKPSFVTVDTMALRGLLLSRRKQHEDAVKILNSTIVDISSLYGPSSMDLGIVTAELANCYNILRQEDKAEECLRTTLQARQDGGLSTRRDGIYLMLALADSFIGRARYQESVPILESVIDNPDISATFRMMSALRLARSRRRMHEDTKKAFEEDSPLWTGLTLLSHVPGVLTMEYVEELACNISEIPKWQLGDSEKTQELIEAVNSVLCRSSSLTNSPCWEWYTKLQQEYLEQIIKATKINKGKENGEGKQNEHKNEMGTSISSHASPRLPPRADDEMSDDEGPWSERLVLSFDAGGVRAISSLLILKRIMHRIRELELLHPDGPAYSSSSCSWTRNENGIPGVLEESDRIDEFLPCHYFDYMAGTSTGGLNSIMLGRLRMSVDQAIDNFIDFGNAVFGQPRVFHTTSAYFPVRAKYSATKAREAFKKIIISSYRVGTMDTAELAVFAKTEPFTKLGRCTRTMVISYRVEEGAESAHIWKSYHDLDSKASISHSATIWEVACATSANPVYLDAIEINGATHSDGALVANNPSYKVLQEIYLQHNRAPSVFVNLGTGRRVETKVILKNDAKRRDFTWKQRLQDLNRAFQSHSTEIYTESNTGQWLVLAESMGLKHAYRLNVERNLYQIPYDDWRPASTGKTTLLEMADITEGYLRQPGVRNVINRIAEEAVRIRRARANTERWEAFTKNTVYMCPFCHSSQPYELYADLRAHLDQYHAEIKMSDSQWVSLTPRSRRPLFTRL
ncbi:acyl transferase/acyl hydrolase/lysophospholipase [Fusarium redolens]|uniref:Acyl transferase/acyl hydrolase/lysophospholipase n=1 Tax=Fusarium redolens TaxID=48865 RepID=A0A9P9R8J9_FUSRE|nr:acyl transferase/acyl hydrolase/lysophospholipase [Fusarium redolens]KAH7269050.1 acyl transferase/acyl hydrolase/lysophospholipase [Fusarium redolens]